MASPHAWCLELVLGALTIVTCPFKYLCSQSIRYACGEPQGPLYMYQVFQRWYESVHQVELPPQGSYQGKHVLPYLCASNTQ